MKVTSLVFGDNELIPKKYTCQGQDINPPLTIEDIPSAAKSLALIVDDPDAIGGMWVHWVVFDIRPQPEIAEDSVPGSQGVNDFGRRDYGGPCPPSGTHRYFFKIYALDKSLNLEGTAGKQQLLAAMSGHILAQAEIIGRYKKL